MRRISCHNTDANKCATFIDVKFHSHLTSLLPTVGGRSITSFTRSRSLSYTLPCLQIDLTNLLFIMLKMARTVMMSFDWNLEWRLLIFCLQLMHTRHSTKRWHFSCTKTDLMTFFLLVFLSNTHPAWKRGYTSLCVTTSGIWATSYDCKLWARNTATL